MADIHIRDAGSRYDVRRMEQEECGRCGHAIAPQYLWCDDCEDLVERVGGSPIWKERGEENHG